MGAFYPEVSTNLEPKTVSLLLTAYSVPKWSQTRGKGVRALDHFHVVKLMNDKLADLRGETQREAEAQEKEVLKGTRWLLVKNPENLDDKRSEGDRLQQALALNAPLAAA